MKFNTDCVQAGYSPKNGDPRVLPLFQSTSYCYDSPEHLANLFDLSASGHIYSRISNPTVDAFEQKINALEGGVGALATASGLAAETTVVLNACKAGDNIVSASEIYGGSFNLFGVTLKKYGVEARFFEKNATDLDIEALIDDNTKILYVESLANPAMTIPDFERFANIAKAHGLLFVVDNTLATPYLVQPLRHGANIVVHSTSKYIDGHASCVGGIIVDGGNFKYIGNPRFAEINSDDASYHGINYARDCGAAAFITKARVQLMRDLGFCPSPFNAYLTNLGCETLHLRMQRHCENALAIAQFLSKNDKIEWVKYAGLDGDENNAMAKKYFKGGFGGMVVFGVKGGRAGANAFLGKLSLIKIVTHIADVRSCALHPASTTHRQMSDQQLVSAGIADNLIRLSVGIEDVQDLILDIANALA